MLILQYTLTGGKAMKKTISYLLVLIFSLSFLSCSSKKPLQILTIGVIPDVDSVPLFVADHMGYFDKENLTIQFQTFSNTRDRDNALQSGEIDGAVSDMLSAAFSKDSGFNVMITSKTDSSYKLLVNKDSKVTELKDLKGKQVAISKNTIAEYATDMMLQEATLGSSDIKKVVIPQLPARLEMLQRGKIEAAVLPEPLASSAVNNGARLLISSDKLGINPGVIIFTSKSIDEKSREISAFYRAYNKAVEYIGKSDKSKYINTIIEKTAFPKEVKDTLILPSYSKAAPASEKDFNSVIKWLKERKLIKINFEYKDLANDKFVK